MELLKEDTELDLETTKVPQDIYELYDEMDDDIFSESNIKTLKSQGNIDPDTGMIITFNPEEDSEPRIMQLEELYRLDYNFIKMPYIQELIINNFKKLSPNGHIVKIEPDNLESNSRYLSTEFLSDCMREDVFEYFSMIDTGSFNDIKNNVDEISDDNKNIIEKLGFPRNIYELLADDTADEEHPLAEYYDDLKSAFELAVNDGETYGAEKSCLEDFEHALEYINIPGVEYKGRGYEDDYQSAAYIIKEEFVKDHIDYIWELLDSFSDDLLSCVQEEFIETFNSELNFREPYSGWYGFDIDTFNESLSNRLYELDIGWVDENNLENED